MSYKVFVDGQEGTTGLMINERLANRNDIEIIKIDPERRKDTDERKKLLNEADIAFLCLPDAAAIEAISLVENPNTRIIDASTAHRTNENWVYGLPELSKEQRSLIKDSKRVAVPGCHATGFNMALYPLIQEGIVPNDYPVTSHSLTGYSGGGKKLIGKYENPLADKKDIESPMFYALGLKHKHLPEMQKVNGLLYPPLFTPIVGDFYKGMAVAIPLIKSRLNKKMTAEDIQKVMADYYASEHFIHVMPFEAGSYLVDGTSLDAKSCNDTNNLEICVFGNEDQILIVSRLDNLGKGSSGAAVQNMNIMIGIDEGTGLE